MFAWFFTVGPPDVYFSMKYKWAHTTEDTVLPSHSRPPLLTAHQHSELGVLNMSSDPRLELTRESGTVPAYQMPKKIVLKGFFV